MEITIINSKEVAKLTNSTIKTVQRKAEKGEYPKGVCGRHGRYWLFNKEKLIEFIFAA